MQRFVQRITSQSGAKGSSNSNSKSFYASTSSSSSSGKTNINSFANYGYGYDNIKELKDQPIFVPEPIQEKDSLSSQVANVGEWQVIDDLPSIPSTIPIEETKKRPIKDEFDDEFDQVTVTINQEKDDQEGGIYVQDKPTKFQIKEKTIDSNGTYEPEKVTFFKKKKVKSERNIRK
jgi:hypothetical protein